MFSDAPNNACFAVESYELSALMSSEASDGYLVPNMESSENIGTLESHRFPLARLLQLRSNPQKSPTHVDITSPPNLPVQGIGIIGT